jgi:Pregnancy-associated plasma protein-A
MISQLPNKKLRLLTLFVLTIVTQGHSHGSHHQYRDYYGDNFEFNTTSVLATTTNGRELFVFGDSVYASQGEFIESGNRCGQSNPTLVEQRVDDAIVRKWIAANGEGSSRMGGTNNSKTSVEIKTYFHLITNGTFGKKTNEQILAQLTVLNKGYQGTGYSFILGGIRRLSNSSWYGTISQFSMEIQLEMKQALRKGNESTLNVYLTKLKFGLLGFASFPTNYIKYPMNDGVVIDTETIPGGYYFPYNEGKTLTHEVGHWMGLYHTFQDGCSGSDFVSDTPAQDTPTYGCPKKKDSCKKKPGLDPIHNYMDYSDDVCLTTFTKKQIARMNALWNEYRRNI